MSNFSGIEKATVMQGGVYPVPGAYTLKINQVKEGKTRHKEDFFCAEFEVIESDAADRPVGTPMSWIVMYKHDSALNNIKSFFAAAAQLPAETITEEVSLKFIGEKQPLAGRVVKAIATNVKTKSGGDFTKMVWNPANA